MSRMPRHSGNAVHPQNPRPAFLPCLAVRLTIGLPQFGHAGSKVGCVVSLGLTDAGVLDAQLEAGRLPADPTCRIMLTNSFPPIRSILRPRANSVASFVNSPAETTKPPAAPLAAIAP